MYDIDDNNLVELRDSSSHAFGLTVGLPTSEPPYAWWADYDKSNQVDFGDLSFFAPNFGMSSAAGQATLFPPNFPAGWAGAPAPAGGDKAFDDGGAEEASMVGHGRLAGFDGVRDALSPGGDVTFATGELVAASSGVLGFEQDPLINVQLVTVLSPSGSDAAATLPSSVTEVDVDDTFYVEVWVRTSCRVRYSRGSRGAT